MNTQIFKAGYEAEKGGVRWYQGPHKGGSIEAYEWDQGHTVARKERAIAELRARRKARGMNDPLNVMRAVMGNAKPITEVLK